MMRRRGTAHWLTATLGMLIVLLIAVAAIAYGVSPLRDPNFSPADSVEPLNAGATIDFLKPERYWISVIQALAVLISTNIAVLIWLNVFRRYIIARVNPLILSLSTLGLFGLWIVMTTSIWYGSFSFLLYQYIID